ncbi:LEAF RUST 10 DISEASE-RESISTANCE LOCUS RECEPTOR-LIKE PROTEIN KINASE-like 2.1 [Amborella trichopoda]|nr:LEAF RUST 10 DISEASE-RESISTANCE LOCUS RECEPTOR-LIKE PROTEIN KINASE-like 2.1 [Amborella trichopoda]XP_020520741.1 LEAF RUST 10 DISEASE-RESISTANCE LOCUS RECEPTOR-LIKE PROTEIN KINASE-like 2.1 [Amborella trichopoda]|eukprot:XP_020520740.1 LEAF RUST 10 DISEASE-RESISTANCE LOCUS RECEPTOR-LIKE PROTEIN KINASE-like 2.1 [Amborella trichopoda]
MAATLPAWFLALLFCCILSRGYDFNPYEECAPVNCSGINIHFPFSAASSPELCGLFKIDCGGLSSPTTIKFLDKSYDVKNISYPERTINITAPLSDFFDNGKCNYFLHKITLPDHIEGFHLLSSYVNISIFYNCDTHSSFNNQETIWAFKGCEKNQEIYYTDKQEIVNNLTPPSACSWIQYPVLESSLKAMKHVNRSWTLLELLKEGIALQWEQFPSECSNCTSSGGRCALNATDRRTTACYCKDGEACDSGILITITMGAILITIAIIMMSKGIIKMSKGVEGQNVEEFLRNYENEMPTRYSYKDIKKMTNNFREKLGQGGFGTVYKGKLIDGRLIAVKVLAEPKGSGEEFINEVATIGRIHHINVVRLLGFCADGWKKALIYDFMPNGSLERFIFFDKPRSHCLHWETLYKVALGTSRGLEYLHRGCETRILHLDIKPHNILLDEDFCPKISDFGLAKLYSNKQSVISLTGARGTIGYMAPEVYSRSFGVVSHKSDVYSFGMLLLEMVGGRKNFDQQANSSEVYFPDWVYSRLECGGDLEVGDIKGEEKEMAKRMMVVGLWCIQINPTDRPSITKVVEMLDGNSQTLVLPPKPSFSSPKKRSSLESDSGHTEMSIL